MTQLRIAVIVAVSVWAPSGGFAQAPQARFTVKVQNNTTDGATVAGDDGLLSVGVHHLMVALRGASLEFTEYMQLTNSSDMAVTGRERDSRDRPVVLRVMLPAGFKDLAASSYLEREALVVTEEGFYDTMAVPPGEHGVAFSYTVDVARGATEVFKEITLPTSQLMIFWEHGPRVLDGLGEPDSRLVNADGVPIDCYRRSNLAPGDRLAFRIWGPNAAGSGGSTWVLLAVVFAAILAVALLRLRHRPTSLERPHA